MLAEGADRPDVVVVVASAAHLARSLYLVAQVRETALPVVVALTMSDVASRRGVQVDTAALAGAIGCPVVALDPRRRSGVDALVSAVGTAWARSSPTRGTAIAASSADELAAADERFGWIDAAVTASVSTQAMTRRTWSDRIDRFATAPVVGPLALPRRHVGGLPGDDHSRRTAAERPRRSRVWAVSSGRNRLVDAIGLDGRRSAGSVVNGMIAGSACC